MDSEGLRSGPETLRVTEALRNYLWRLNMTPRLRVTVLKADRRLSGSLHDDLTHRGRETGALGPGQTETRASLCRLLT